MKKILQCLVLLTAVLVVFSSCATSTLQTAKTTPKGKVDLFIGGTFLPDADNKGFLPEFGFRAGISDRLDLGLRIFGSGFMGEAKFGIVQNQIGLNLAVTGGLGYSFLIIPFYSYELGGIISIDTEHIAPYASIKIHKFGLAGDTVADDVPDGTIGEFIVLAGGICLFPQSKVSLFAELNWFKPVKLFGETLDGTSQAILAAGIRLRL